MTSAWQNRIDVGCSFCSAVLAIDVAPTGGGAVQAPKRDTVVAKVKCTACDSITELWLQTKRRGKGKRFRAKEAADKASHALRVDAREIENDQVALALLAESGCTCARYAPNDATARYYDHLRRDGLQAGGFGPGRMPHPPRHRRDCPAWKDAS